MRVVSSLAGLIALVASVAVGCSGSPETSDQAVGALALSLDLGGGETIHLVQYSIEHDGTVVNSGTIDTSAPGATASVEVFGLPPGGGYTVTLTATTVDGLISCEGSADFEVETGAVTEVHVSLHCDREPTLGSVRADGTFNFCAELAKVIVSPLQTSVGNDIELSAAAWDVEDDPVTFLWTATGGSIENPNAPDTRFTCTEAGNYSVVASVSDDIECSDQWEVAVTCVGDGAGECVIDTDCLGVFPLPTCRFPTTCAAGTCVQGELLAAGTPCLRGGTCRENGRCAIPQCMTDSDCAVFIDPNECRQPVTCIQDPLDDFSFCQLGTPLPAGTPCSADACDGFGECLGDENPVKSQVVRVACKNSITVDPSFLPSLLTVRPPNVWKADPTETDVWTLGGEAVFDKQFLDAAQAVILGGVTVARLIDLNWTVQVRSGATMDDVTLRPAPIPFSCQLDRTVLCDPGNDLPDTGGNSDCTPTGGFNSCGRFVPLSTSTDCAPGGLCRSSGAAPTAQCEANGFCVSDALRVPLEEAQVEVTPDAADAYVTFGWHERTDRGLNPDGTYVLPVAVFREPTGPIGFRTNVGALSAGLECMGGGNAGWTFFGPFPVPDELLLQYFVPAP